MSLARYGKRADLIVHEYEPFNVETGRAALAEASLTAVDAFYVRGHGAVPEVAPRVAVARAWAGGARAGPLADDAAGGVQGAHRGGDVAVCGQSARGPDGRP